MFLRTSSDCSVTSKPATLALPEVGGRKQVRTRIVVVFPAPFLPRKPTISPLPTSKEMFLTATLRAYRFVRPSTLIIVMLFWTDEPGRPSRSPDCRQPGREVLRLSMILLVQNAP